MDRGVESRRKAKSLISSIKRINDDPNGLSKSSADGFRDDLGLDKTKRNLNDYTSKVKGRSQGTRDIFSDILDTVDEVLGTEKEDKVNPGLKSAVQSKSLKYSKIAAEKALLAGKQIIIDSVKSGYFSGEGGCSSNSEPLDPSYRMSPKEFDLTNMLKINPSSNSGKLLYETLPDDGIGVQFNRKLFEKFDSPVTEAVEKKDGTTLFNLAWHSPTQKYIVTPGSGVTISNFITEYYNTIELPSLSNVMEKAMLMSIQGDGTEAASFNVGMNYMNRLLTKLFAVCGTEKGNDSPFLTNATNLITEDELDVQDYFNFDDVEGIDLDDENNRKRRVLKFVDCNSFEIPINLNHIEDFSYLSGSKNLDENIDNTLKKVAVDAYEQSDGSIYLEGFEISIMKSYILQIPRALISELLSPKMIFPISLSYQMLDKGILDVKDMMRSLAQVFFDIIKTVFWTFIREFWALAKKDVLAFVKDLAVYIVLNSIKRIKAIVLALINLLLNILEGRIQSCSEIFDTILKVLQAALNRSIRIPVPGLLLVLSEALPGFSPDRAYIDALQRMEDAGINTGDIYGSENKLPSLVKSMIDAYSSEMDSNSYVKIALKPSVIPAGPGGAVISPLVTGSGKLF